MAHIVNISYSTNMPKRKANNHHHRKGLLASSRIQFRSVVACATFFARKLATCRSFQIFHWSFCGEVTSWNAKLVDLIVSPWSRMKTRNSFRKGLLVSSRIQFRSVVASATFFARNLATCQSFQIFHWSFCGEVTSWNAKLVDSILSHRSRLKTRNSFRKGLFASSRILFRSVVACATLNAQERHMKCTFMHMECTCNAEKRHMKCT